MYTELSLDVSEEVTGDTLNCQSGTYKPYNNPAYIADSEKATHLESWKKGWGCMVRKTKTRTIMVILESVDNTHEIEALIDKRSYEGNQSS